MYLCRDHSICSKNRAEKREDNMTRQLLMKKKSMFEQGKHSWGNLPRPTMAEFCYNRMMKSCDYKSWKTRGCSNSTMGDCSQDIKFCGFKHKLDR